MENDVHLKNTDFCVLIPVSLHVCGVRMLGPLSQKNLNCYPWDYSVPGRAQRVAGRKRTLRPQYELNHAAILCLGTSSILHPFTHINQLFSCCD